MQNFKVLFLVVLSMILTVAAFLAIIRLSVIIATIIVVLCFAFIIYLTLKYLAPK